jgi:hypothetical protein
LTPDLDEAEFDSEFAMDIGLAAQDLIDKRNRWLNPPDWIERRPEVVPGFPDQIFPRDGREDDLRKRTLTKLYNDRPAWLENAHRELDAAVSAAYGWSAELADDQVLANLLQLNLERAAEGRQDVD